MSTIGSSLVPLLPRLRRYALALCKVADTADELVQIACEKALASPRQTLDVSFEAWMFRILRNGWIDRLRRQKTRGE
jgi:RNA polymerase sigma-70 factor (ECF subfamily)